MTKTKTKTKTPPPTPARTRKLRDGSLVPELPGLVKIELTTHCPAKWAMVDLETGEVWVHDAAKGYARASQDHYAMMREIARRGSKS